MLTFQAVVIANDTASLWGILVNPQSSRKFQASKTVIFQGRFEHSVILIFQDSSPHAVPGGLGLLNVPVSCAESRSVVRMFIGLYACIIFASKSINIHHTTTVTHQLP